MQQAINFFISEQNYTKFTVFERSTKQLPKSTANFTQLKIDVRAKI